MAILVIAEHNNAALAAATQHRCRCQAIGGDIHVLVAGQNVAAVAEAAAKVEGVSKVLVADNAAYAHQLPENVAPLIAELGKNYSHVLAPATTNGKNFPAARRRAAGRRPDLRDRRSGQPRHLQASDLRR